MEGAHQFLDQPGVSNCGHMELIEHGNYHEGNADTFFGIQGTRDTGHDGHGRAPATDCTVYTDEAGHALGGAWRFAAYAQAPVASCLNNVNTYDSGDAIQMLASSWHETFQNVQLGAGTNVITLTETGGDMGLDFIELTASDGVHSASRLGHAHITADNGYVFYVDGVRVGAGGSGLTPDDPAFSPHGWTRTDFFSFEASCETPTAYAIEGVDDSGVAAVLAEIEHCGTTTRTSDGWKCGVPSAVQNALRPTTRCVQLLDYQVNVELVVASQKTLMITFRCTALMICSDATMGLRAWRRGRTLMKTAAMVRTSAGLAATTTGVAQGVHQIGL